MDFLTSNDFIVLESVQSGISDMNYTSFDYGSSSCNDCNNSCYGGCRGSCAEGCRGDCSDSCDGNCYGTCLGDCADTCEDISKNQFLR